MGLPPTKCRESGGATKMKRRLVSCFFRLGRRPWKITAPWKKIYRKSILELEALSEIRLPMFKKTVASHRTCFSPEVHYRSRFPNSGGQFSLNDTTCFKFRYKLFSRGSGKSCFFKKLRRIFLAFLTSSLLRASYDLLVMWRSLIIAILRRDWHGYEYYGHPN